MKHGMKRVAPFYQTCCLFVATFLAVNRTLTNVMITFINYGNIKNKWKKDDRMWKNKSKVWDYGVILKSRAQAHPSRTLCVSHTLVLYIHMHMCRGSAADRLLGLQVRIPLEEWMSVSCECCVLSGRGLCDGPITRPEESTDWGV